MAISQELKEVYASVGPEVILHTLELKHPSFNNSFFIVRDWNDFTANLENSGPSVLFQKFAFNVTEPKRDSQGNQFFNVTIDAVNQEIVNLLDSAVDGSRIPIKVVYRIYLASDTSGPQNTPPPVFEFRNITVNNFRVSGAAESISMINRRFPNVLYGDTFRSLLVRA